MPYRGSASARIKAWRYDIFGIAQRASRGIAHGGARVAVGGREPAISQQQTRWQPACGNANMASAIMHQRHHRFSSAMA